MVDFICESAEESSLGFVTQGELYAKLLCVLPSMSTMEFNKLILLAISTGRVEKGRGRHTIRPVK
jgi:hypothetical protein